MNRWKATLACSHHVVCDDRFVEGDKEFCQACGDLFTVLECVLWFDEDAV